MSKLAIAKTARGVMLCAASALALSLAGTAAKAADRDDPDSNTYARQDTEIEVIAPRPRPEHSTIGAPIRNVGLQKDVRFDDLDLRTAYGEHVLKNRIRQTARNLCQELHALYPISADGVSTTPGPKEECYRNAVDNAMEQANAAIGEARHVARND
jgi:UrcA family protein